MDAEQLGGLGPRPGQAARRWCRASRLDELAADKEFLRMLELPGPTSSTTSPATAGSRSVPPPATRRRSRWRTSPRSTASPRCCRSTPAASASSPETTSRPRATSVSRSIGVGLLYRHGYFRQSLSREGWQQETYPVARPRRPADHAAARGRRLARPGHPRHPRRPPAARPDLGRPGRPRAAAAPRLRPRGEPRAAARRHRPAVRRHRRAPAAPGAAARRRRRPGAARVVTDHRRRGARGLPHQRGPRRLPGPGADPRAHRRRRRTAPRLRDRARGHPCRHRLHDAHPGARQASTGSRAS